MHGVIDKAVLKIQPSKKRDYFLKNNHRSKN